MSVLADVVLFVLGVYLSIRAIAALYGIIDLWYTIGTAWPRVVGRLIGWGGMIALIAVLLGDQRRVFFSGFVAFLIFYLSLFPLRHLVLRRQP
jgi:hypothetical protein